MATPSYVENYKRMMGGGGWGYLNRMLGGGASSRRGLHQNRVGGF